MSDNLALWNAVERTDPAHVKLITGKAYRGNSPKPHYLIHKATETFGPCGIGWGFDIVEERLLDGALIAPGFYERVHMARVRVWYDWEGKRGTVEHVGQTLFSGKRRSGEPFTDEDAPKKSVTDALIKALSLIGFAGDIFMGRYDDNKYVAELREEFTDDPEPPQKLRDAKKPDRFAPNARDRAKARADEAAPTVPQVGIYRERVKWLKGATTAAELKDRAKNPEHLQEVKKLTESQKNDLRGFYLDTSAKLMSAILAAG